MTMVLFSCREEHQKPIVTHFVYKNATPHAVELRLTKASNTEVHTIAQNKSVQLTNIETAEHTGDTGILHPFEGYEKVVIAFPDLNKCTVNFEKIRNVKKYDNFSEAMYQNTENTLIYVIDDEELTVAANCN